MNRFCAIGILLAALSFHAGAQTVAITGGKVYTMTGDEPLEGATVLIEDGRIEVVGTDVDVPEGARVFDAAGRIVTPGLIDAHGQIGLVEVSAESGTMDAGMDVGRQGDHPMRTASARRFSRRTASIPPPPWYRSTASRASRAPWRHPWPPRP
jgi:imidazolonepropionase-like amidohydrolase